ncbi:MAG: hypothetical protein MK180_14840 [Rhodobacteraceae bacterium]|nr:hypothetical protein [Paracoccaceae bacterium]
MIRSTLIAVATVLSAGPARTDSHGGEQSFGRYTSFAVKVPYEFDLPSEIATAFLDCQIEPAGPGFGVSDSVPIDLTKGTSGVAMIGYGDFD